MCNVYSAGEGGGAGRILVANPRYPASFKRVCTDLSIRSWRTRSSIGKESHLFSSRMNPS